MYNVKDIYIFIYIYIHIYISRTNKLSIKIMLFLPESEHILMTEVLGKC